MLTFLIFILLMAISFLCSALLFWILTLALSAFGIVIVFTWGKAFAFWIICMIIRAMLGLGGSKD